MGQRGQGDVAGRLAAGRAVLAVQLGGEAVQGAGPHVLRGGRGVGGTGGWRAALGGRPWRVGGGGERERAREREREREKEKEKKSEKTL